MSSRRVVVTGVGVVSPFGEGVEPFWDGVLAGTSPAQIVDVPGVGETVAFLADDAPARERFGAREVRRMSRAGRFAAIAAGAALDMAGLSPTRGDAVGVSIACVHGGIETWFDAHEVFRARGADRVSPLAVPLALTNSPAAAAARVLGLGGPSLAVTTACAAGSDAIGLATGMIRHGRARVVVAGGAEAPVSPLVVAAYRQLGALSPARRPAEECSRPFDTARDGFVMGEGAGILVLEDADHARARGATVLAEVVGYGSSCDAAHLTDPDPEGTGPARAIRAALADAGIDAAEVGYVNAHATSTPAGDAAEARAIHAAGLQGAAVSSTKGAHGHMLGAAGGIEAVACVCALHRGMLPPTANLHDPDPHATLDLVRLTRAWDGHVAVSNSFGFGGHNATLVMRAAD